ncbi:DNA gyrase subunit A [Pelagicoccus sp. SDUM812005]|uniref:DNA gyrase subunit A n=1 Tax=Pelagicoccus sp. SDUM812005 TaxID=3041257 RepID=UPI00280E04C1|nr:DNA gyrase subunit A [Pelagicoccus sp. SDUM812005]MDQ8183408.1 DNA gyrase subunit A [Pelagicoccus sp. SDUM812005]
MENISNERISQTSITDIMQTAYIDYSMSVIVSRALPDARDGLKPVQRRILYAMLREGLLHNRAFDKCAGVVGEVLKNYHPHGDGSVYDTLVRMAQNWVMRYPLIDPQGNFGSVDGDSPAAYRYTEARLTAIAEDLLRNIDEDTVDFVPNYKESTTEPSVLPAGLPNLLMNGSTGIAVGMATNIPPHNLDELIDGICAQIDNPNITIAELGELIQGPDFPTGGRIIGRKGIDEYMHTGRGIVRMRGAVTSEPMDSGDRERIIISTIPYNVNRASLVTKIAELVSTKEIEGISDLRDESDENTRIVVELKRGEFPEVIISKLYKKTALESSFGVNMLALDNKRPKQMNIKEMINCYIDHRREVIYRRTAFRLQKAEDRAHILEGYKIALDNLDDFIKIIRSSANRDEAKVRLQEKYPLSDRQVAAILDLRLYQLTGMERGKIEEEYAELLKLIEELRSILENEYKLLSIIKEELLELKEKYTSPRKCEIVPYEGDISKADMTPKEGCFITISHKGFIKRVSDSEFRTQKRGGKGVQGGNTYEDDFVEHIFTANTHDTIMFFMNNGRVYVEKVYELPEGSRTSKGRSINNVLQLQKDEQIAAMICVKEISEDFNLVMCTKNGTVKKTNLAAYKNFRKGGIIGINIDEGDSLITVKLTNRDSELVIVTHLGKSIRFHESDLREQGRATRGVRGIKLAGKDYAQAMEVVDNESALLICGINGQGKRTVFDEFPLQKRGGSGVIAAKTSGVAGALAVRENDEIMMLTKNGQAVRTKVADINLIGRITKGVRCINLNEGDKLLGIARIVEDDEEKDEDTDETTTAPEETPSETSSEGSNEEE